MPGWGATTSDESKPKWEWLSSRLANTFATDSGWAHRWPWGDEILVAIGGLATNLGVASLVDVLIPSALPYNAEGQTVTVGVLFNEAVTVTGSPTIVAIGTGTANVTLTYSAALSELSKGFVAFSIANTDLTLAEANAHYTVNSSSTFENWTGIKDAGTANAVAAENLGALVGTLPIQRIASVTDVLHMNVNYPMTNTANQFIVAEVSFTKPVHLANTEVAVSILAIGNDESTPNAVLTLVPGHEWESPATLIFVSEAIDMSSLTPVEDFWSVNSSSTLVGFTNIIDDASGKSVANSITIAEGGTFAIDPAEPAE